MLVKMATRDLLKRSFFLVREPIRWGGWGGNSAVGWGRFSFSRIDHLEG
jgi:hypothetical protein